MSVVSAIIKSRILAFNVMRTQFSRTGERLLLLKHRLDSSYFVPIIEITGGYFVNFNNYREQMQFEFATENVSFSDIFAQTSHIGYGVPDAQNLIDVFSIEARDKIPPNGTSPTYKCFGVRASSERFYVPPISGVTVIVIPTNEPPPSDFPV